MWILVSPRRFEIIFKYKRIIYSLNNKNTKIIFDCCIMNYVKIGEGE
jgi:hypothetical protein